MAEVFALQRNLRQVNAYRVPHQTHGPARCHMLTASTETPQCSAIQVQLPHSVYSVVRICNKPNCREDVGGLEPFEVVAEPFNVPVEPFDVPVEPFDVVSEPFDVPLEPFDVVSVPFDVPAEPFDVPPSW